MYAPVWLLAAVGSAVASGVVGLGHLPTADIHAPLTTARVPRASAAQWPVPAAPAPPATTPPVPQGPAGSWRMVFDSEFSSSSLNTSKWSTCYDWSCNNAGNNELEWYTPANDTVSGGVLSLTAKRQPVTVNGRTYPYTSGLIQTNRKFSFTYGFAEMRAQLPAGRGMWPAFWMLPTNYSWPPEIDVMEAAGDLPNQVSLTYHYGANQQTQTYVNGPNFTAGFHTFGVDWQPGRITWYIDGTPYKTVAMSPSGPMYLLANLAVDGDSPPSPSTVLPAAMKIDYIRVWQQSSAPAIRNAFSAASSATAASTGTSANRVGPPRRSAAVNAPSRATPQISFTPSTAGPRSTGWSRWGWRAPRGTSGSASSP